MVERELSPEEAYAGSALFTVALHARQGSYRQATADSVKGELLEAEEGAKVARPGEVSKRPSGRGGGSSSFLREPSLLERSLAFVEDQDAVSSTNHLAKTVYRRLGVSERAWTVGALFLPPFPVTASHGTMSACFSGFAADPLDLPRADGTAGPRDLPLPADRQAQDLGKGWLPW